MPEPSEPSSQELLQVISQLEANEKEYLAEIQKLTEVGAKLAKQSTGYLEDRVRVHTLLQREVSLRLAADALIQGFEAGGDVTELRRFYHQEKMRYADESGCHAGQTPQDPG